MSPIAAPCMYQVERQRVGWSGIKSAPSAAAISVVMLVTVGFFSGGGGGAWLSWWVALVD